MKELSSPRKCCQRNVNEPPEEQSEETSSDVESEPMTDFSTREEWQVWQKQQQILKEFININMISEEQHREGESISLFKF